jgi:HEAT repeat protein
MRHVFISYCHEDADFVHVLEDRLNQSGISVWKDADLRAGDAWHAEIEGAIRSAAAVIVILSESAQASEYVKFEWAFAAGAGVPVVPLLLKIRPAALHPRLRSLQALDFTNYMLRPWDALVQSLKAVADAERPFTVAVPRDAPPFIQKAARELDSQDRNERLAAITMLAEIHDPSVREVLAEAVRHPDADVRDLAAKSLAEDKDLRALPGIMDAIRYKRWNHINTSTLKELGEAAVPILVKLLRDPAQGAHVRRCIASALKDLRNDEAVEALGELLHDPESEVRIQAVESLAGHPQALPWLLESAARDPEIAYFSMRSLKYYRGPEVVATLIDGLKSADTSVRQAAAEGLKEMPDANEIPALIEALRDDDNIVVSYARVALAQVIDHSWTPKLFEVLEQARYKPIVASLLDGLGGDAVFHRMLELLKSGDRELRETAASSLGHIGNRAAVPDLLLALKDTGQEVRKMAAFALGDLKDIAAMPELIAVMRDELEEYEVRNAAGLALSKIGTREARMAYKEWERLQAQS